MSFLVDYGRLLEDFWLNLQPMENDTCVLHEVFQVTISLTLTFMQHCRTDTPGLNLRDGCRFNKDDITAESPSCTKVPAEYHLLPNNTRVSRIRSYQEPSLTGTIWKVLLLKHILLTILRNDSLDDKFRLYLAL